MSVRGRSSAGRGSLVLSGAEWRRIKAAAVPSASGTAHSAAQLRDAQRLSLYEQSRAQVAKWSNTIAGQREAKLKAKALREAEAEEKARLIDEEETRYQAEEKQKIIDHANKVKYMQNDRVKQLNAAFATAEVNRARETQIDTKRNQDPKNSQSDAELLKIEEEERQHAIYRELEKQKQARLDALMLAEGQLQQAAQKRQERRNRHEEVRNESELLEHEIKQFKQDEAVKASKRKEKAKNLSQEFNHQMQEIEARKKAEIQSQLEEEERMRATALELQRKNEERRQEEKNRRQQIENQRDKIRQLLSTSEAAQLAKEEMISNKAAEDQKKKEEEARAEKERRKQERLSEMAHHRDEEQKRKAHERYADKLKEHEMLNFLESDAKAYNEEVKQKKQARLHAIKEVQKEHVNSITTKNEARKKEKEEDVALRQSIEESLRQEDEMFQQFAAAKLNEAEKKNLSNHAHILKKVAARNDSTIRKPMEQAGHPVLVDTHRRLGFNWDD